MTSYEVRTERVRAYITLLRRLAAPATVLLVAFSLAACAGDGDDGQDPTDPPTGETDFVSADGRNGEESGDSRDEGEPSDDGAAGDEGGDRVVEEGDIYRLTDGGRLINLNAYRGIQIIDVSNLDTPHIIGRLRVSGTPVEMYVVDDRAYVLLNNWRGYYGDRADVAVDSREGGLLLSVDISDPTAPRTIDREVVDGFIQTSRLVRGGDSAALYIAASRYGEWTTPDGETRWESRTIVDSFDVSDGTFTARDTLDLGGYVADIQATPSALLVARNDWTRSEAQSDVTIVDISDPAGSMRQGDTVRTEGTVSSKFNMDLHGDVLRIVSGSSWRGTRTNHVETFDASDFSELTRIDHATFGDGENLFATLFLGNKAFFVTYLRVDPFHAFEITDDGEIFERSEFIVSGWNDFFRPVFDERRLIGVGMNDEEGRRMAISLYDITDLSEPEPMLARAEVDAQWSWSEASWDDRAFSVVEGAVSVESEDGTVETGLVLLPFSGYNPEDERYESSVQIFTFSETTLTRRGRMVHGTPVRRSFVADDDTAANLSEAELSVFDCSDPDAPTERSRLELAPSYTDLVPMGDWSARVVDRADHWYGWWSRPESAPSARVEIIDADDHPDEAAAVSSFEIPAFSNVHRVGDHLVVVSMTVAETEEWPYTYDTTAQVYDLSDPRSPRAMGAAETDTLTPYRDNRYGYYHGEPGLADECFDCGGYYYGGGSDGTFATAQALAFLQADPERELLGTERVCRSYARGRDCEHDERGEPGEGCSWYEGGITCRSLDGAEPVCTGTLAECRVESDGSYHCDEVEDPSTVELEESCWENERYRYWQRFSLTTLDVSDPSSPRFAATIELDREDEGVTAVSDGETIYLSYRRPISVEGDPRGYVRYYARGVDLSDPTAPAVADEINVPGELIAVRGDTAYTKDFVWGDEIIEVRLAKVRFHEGRAFLQASHRFEDQYVESIALDESHSLLVSHREAWRRWTTEIDDTQYLTILSSDELDRQAQVAVDRWAGLREATAGRALFQVPGGILMFNLDDPTAPYAQAWFAVRGWPQRLVASEDQISMPAGRHGIYRFDLDEFNLLPPL